jgi:hypothetical protein
MNKIISLCIIAVSFLLPTAVSAQSKQVAEQEFVSQLNHILKISKPQQWGSERTTMSIDSAFALNKEGILSVTVRYTKDSTYTRVRKEAPVNKIIHVAYDLYLILEYNEEEVTIYNSEPGSNELSNSYKSSLLHIGAPDMDASDLKVKLQKALDDLLKFYPGK